LVAFGDAENDLPMLTCAEMGVAARDSIPAVVAVADDSVTQPGGAGVALYIRQLIERQGLVPTPVRRAVTLGKNTAGAAVTLPAAGCNLVISGDPRSGKSWIAGLLAEQLIDKGYRICIVDPEGDYAQMAQKSKIVAFGHDLTLPSIVSLGLALALGLLVGLEKGWQERTSVEGSRVAGIRTYRLL
jgi:hypothetical protein